MSGGYGSNPYAPEGNYNPYATAEQGQAGYGQPYEMNTLSNPGQLTTEQFYSEVDDIRSGIETVNGNISRIESLHSRSLSDIDGASQQTARQLEQIVSETSALNSSLVNRIRTLRSKAGSDPSKAPQVGVLDRSMRDALQRYQLVEKNFADRTREQMARQYRIVRPDATEEEVQRACEDSQGTQVFSQALLSGSRRGEAGTALREVQARHNEIQRIEKTITELAQLFEQMNQMIVEQETMVENIDQRGEEVAGNTGRANVELDAAVEKAKSARRKKWWCLLIVILIIIVIVVIAVVVTQVQKSTK